MIFNENSLPADDSHEISCLIRYFLKKRQNFKLPQNIGGALSVNRMKKYTHLLSSTLLNGLS